MKRDDLMNKLDRYGADLSRWPDADRAEAEAFLQGGAGDDWADWRAAEAIDAFMTAPVAPPSRELLDRVMTIPQRAAPLTLNSGNTIWDTLNAWLRPLSAAAVTCSLIAGLWLGPMDTTSDTLDNDTDIAVLDDGAGAADIRIPGLTWSPDAPDAHEEDLL